VGPFFAFGGQDVAAAGGTTRSPVSTVRLEDRVLEAVDRPLGEGTMRHGGFLTS
jgi:hypothetical protein